MFPRDVTILNLIFNDVNKYLLTGMGTWLFETLRYTSIVDIFLIHNHQLWRKPTVNSFQTCRRCTKTICDISSKSKYTSEIPKYRRMGLGVTSIPKLAQITGKDRYFPDPPTPFHNGPKNFCSFSARHEG